MKSVILTVILFAPIFSFAAMNDTDQKLVVGETRPLTQKQIAGAAGVQGVQEVLWERTDSGRSSSWLLTGVGLLLLVCAGYIIVQSLFDEDDEAAKYKIIEHFAM
jgi:hypothetical protein